MKQKEKNHLKETGFPYKFYPHAGRDIFGNFSEQFDVTKVFQALFKIRERLLERDKGPASLGKNSRPCV